MILGVILVILIDGLTAALFRSLPIKCANFKKRIFIVSKKEKLFYEKIKIKNWKDKIPEIGHFTGFRKNKVLDPKNPEYIKRFLHEICYGEMGHFARMFTGIFLLLIPWFKSFWIYLCIVIIIINAFLNLLPIFFLIYNSFTLYSIYSTNFISHNLHLYSQKVPASLYPEPFVYTYVIFNLRICFLLCLCRYRLQNWAQLLIYQNRYQRHTCTF